MSESLGRDVVADKARIWGICGLAALLAERAAVRYSMGAILLAIVGGGVVAGQLARRRKRGKVAPRAKGKSMSSNILEQL